MTLAKRIGMVILYLLLTVNAILSGLTLASARRTEAAVKSEVSPLATEVFIHGYCAEDTGRRGLAGVTLELWYEGRFIRSKTTVAGGEFGFGDTAKLGLFQLRVLPPPGWAVTGAEPFANTTDFGFVGDVSTCQFRVSPAGGVTEIWFYLHNVATPTATWIPTPTLTPTRTVTPSATPTIMPTPTPTRDEYAHPTPGPTPTACYREPSAAMVRAAREQFYALFPPPDDELTRFGFELALGWPMMEQAMEVEGQRFVGQLWTPFTVVVAWGDGCYSIIDAWTLWHGG